MGDTLVHDIRERITDSEEGERVKQREEQRGTGEEGEEEDEEGRERNSEKAG